MNKKIVEQIKKDLLDRKKQIEKDLQGFTKKDIHEKNARQVEFPNYGDESDESAQEIDDYSTYIATEKVLEDTMADISNALNRIKKHTYGVCKYCKEEIGEKRLLARPVANTCVACKTKLQKMT